MKPWSELKGEFSLSKNSHFYKIQLSNAIPKPWKENLHNGDKNFHDLTFSRYHITKKNQIYSLSKRNIKELYSLQVSLNDYKPTSQVYFEKLFQNKGIEWKCIYLMPHCVTFDTNLCIFQYKILNNVLYLNEKLFKFKVVSSILCSFCNWEDETPIHLFHSCNQTNSLWSKLQELLNSEILLPQNTSECFLLFPDHKENFETINHLHLIFKYYLFKSWDTRKINLEELKKNIIKIYNIEKQICFNDSKKKKKKKKK